ncbi:unnamed protein product [Enterobius vermicularis]|uniref:RING-type domain-containing protein n=1 Tax=Enterobius vermicularis TaxID=51028 RepID=A0A0N4UWT1_ENTVE|nr:unnamed protein product [Enterobius vermicularis]
MEEVSVEDESELSAGHPCCNACVLGEVERILEEERSIDMFGLSCMGKDDCKNILPWEEIARKLPDQLSDQLEAMIQKENLNALGIEVESCKKCGFPAVLETSKEEDQIFECPECGAQHCRLCHENWIEEHEILSCDEMRALGLRHAGGGKCKECGNKCSKWWKENDEIDDDKLDSNEAMESSAKEHNFCSSCIRKQVQEIVNGSSVVDLLGIPCPSAENCSNIISWPDLRNHVTGVLKRRLGAEMQKANLRVSGVKTESCKNCDYTAVLEVPKEQDQVFRCPKCGAQHCRICSEKWTEKHGQRPCSEDASIAFRQ